MRSSWPGVAGLGLVVALLSVAGCSGTGDGPRAAVVETSIRVAPAPAPITQPAQPRTGPGGSHATNRGWRVSSGGTGADGWYVFEPLRPRPRSAPVTIVMHGYYDFSGYGTMEELIRHTVRTGSIVIYPRWQTDAVTPCPGPFDIEPCMRSAVNGIRGGLAYLRADPSRVQPDVRRASYFGFSFGGIITANLANRYRTLHLPTPRAIFLDDPHDGALTGPDEPALDDSMHGIPSDVLLECHDGAEGVLAEFPNGGCNALFPMLGQIPSRDKAIVMTKPDGHGQPPLSSVHGVCQAPRGHADAYDWNFCWKVWDALRSAALGGPGRRYALGDTPQHRSNGRWSDGVPVAPLEVRHRAPIAP